MLSVGAREKAGVSIKYSVMALCEISHSQICDPESVRFLFHVFGGGFCLFFWMAVLVLKSLTMAQTH